MLSISSFQFFVSFCCVFIKFGTKFDRATLLEISFLHFRNTSLLHTLTQLAVKSDVLMLLSWNFHWSSSNNVCLGWCLMCGYSIASCWATHSVSLLSWCTTYIGLGLKISNFLNSFLHEVLGCAVIIILILICKVNIFLLYEEFPQRLIP